MASTDPRIEAAVPRDRRFYESATALAAAGEQLHQRGWVPATSGNFSLRLSPTTAIVTASGRHKGKLGPDDFIAVDQSGTPLTDGKPSAETLLHTQLYARFANIGAVLHCHSVNSTVLSLETQSNELVLSGYEVLKAFSGVDCHNTKVVLPIFDNDQTISRLAAKVDTYLAAKPDCPAYLIRGHGVYCWSDDLDSCLDKLEAVEFLLQCELERRRLHPGQHTGEKQ